MSSPHRTTYRVEQVVREPTDVEKAIVRGRREEWRNRRYAVEIGTWNSFGATFVVSTVLVICLGAFTSRWTIMVGGALAAGLIGLIHVVAARRANARVDAMKCEWDPPSGAWRVCDVTIFARAMVAAVSGDEDYMEWWLFEIPGGDWYFLDPVLIPHRPFRACEEIRITALDPDGPILAIDSTGDPLPRRGAPEDDYVAAMENGCVWHPEKLSRGTVAEPKLPEWVRT